MYLKEITEEEFDKFTKAYFIKSIYQTKEYAHVMYNQGFSFKYIGFIIDNKIIGASLILIKKINRLIAFAPRGILIDYSKYNIDNVTNLLKEYLSKLNIFSLKINPIILKNIYNYKKESLITNPYYDNIFLKLTNSGFKHLGYNNYFESLKPRFEAIIDLNDSIENLFKNVKKEYRTKIRSAIKNGIKVYKGDIGVLDKLYEFNKDKYIRDLNYYKDAYNYFNSSDMIDIYYTKIDFKVYLQTIQNTLNYYLEIEDKLNNKLTNKNKNSQKLIDKKMNNDIIISEYKNKLIEATNLLKNENSAITSVAIVIKQNDTATILIDGYDLKYKKFNSKHLLIWQLIEIYKNKNYKKFNLGGLSNTSKDTTNYSGLNLFKLNFGSKVYEYSGDFELSLNKKNYNFYRNYVPIKNILKAQKK